MGNKITILSNLISKLIAPLKRQSILSALPNYAKFVKDLNQYRKMEGAEKIKIADLYPFLNENTAEQSFDPHYFYQEVWAFKKILESKATHHIDVGSKLELVGFLSTITKVTYIDIRPFNINLENYQSKKGSILDIPCESNSVSSLSCLHVIEHIGLGRYGDTLDPMGTKKSCKELSRVLSIGGDLYLSTPIGGPRVCFNGLRIHSPTQILAYFPDLEMVQLDGIDPQGNYIRNISLKELEGFPSGLGMFHFKKPTVNKL